MNLDGLIKLPEPGGYLSRSSLGPCSCGAAVFQVTFAEREIHGDGETFYRETVDVACPVCPLLSDRTVRKNWLIGTFDTRTGALELIESSPVEFSAPAVPAAGRARAGASLNGLEMDR